MRTSRLNQRRPTPRPRVALLVSARGRADRRLRADRPAVSVAVDKSATGPGGGLDLGDDAEGVVLLAVTEELVVGLAPAVEVTVDGELRGRLGERGGRVEGTLD